MTINITRRGFGMLATGGLAAATFGIATAHAATPDEIIAFANGKLAGYKKVHYIEIVESIPKNASGKILRRELKELEKARREGK